MPYIIGNKDYTKFLGEKDCQDGGYALVNSAYDAIIFHDEVAMRHNILQEVPDMVAGFMVYEIALFLYKNKGVITDV